MSFKGLYRVPDCLTYYETGRKTVFPPPSARTAKERGSPGFRVQGVQFSVLEGTYEP